MRNLKLIGSIAIAVLLLSSSPSWAEKKPSVATLVNIPAFVFPTGYAERLELVGFPGSLPVTQAVDLNSRVLPVVIQPSSTKFQVSGQNCWIKDGVLKASEPAICKVIAARAGSPFSPITVLSAPAFFYFGTIPTGATDQSLPLPTLNVPLPTLILNPSQSSSPPGQAITLTTSPVDDAMTYSETSGTTSCVITGKQLVKATPGTCSIRAIKAQDGANSTKFSPIVIFTFHGSTPQDPPLSIYASPPTGDLGNTITLSTLGGSGTGTVSYEITSGNDVGSITGITLTATKNGSITVVATKQGDAQYAPIVSESAVFEFRNN